VSVVTYSRCRPSHLSAGRIGEAAGSHSAMLTFGCPGVHGFDSRVSGRICYCQWTRLDAGVGEEALELQR
jgi:hypothetical protein